MRFLIECTYVYEHPHDNSGIQRVVRNVINNLQHLETTVECIPVILKQGKVYRVKQLAPPAKQKVKPRLQAWLTLQHDRLARMRQRVNLYQAARERSALFSNSAVLRRVLALTCSAVRVGFALPQKCLAYISLNYVDTSRIQELPCRSDDVLVLLDSSWHADFFPVAEELKSRGVRIVSVIYDLIPLTHPQFCDENLVRVFEHWFDWVTRTADGFIAISHTIIEQVQHEVQQRLGQTAAEQRWFDYFHLGSDLDQADPRTAVRAEVEQMFRQRPIYLMVSTIEPRKNHAYLLDAFDKLWSEGHEVGLCFVGKVGWKTEQLIERVRQHPHLGKKLFMWNDLSDRELEYCYLNARSLVFPSYVEGFGLPLVEAMQRGLPVMASDIPVFREIGGDSMAYFELAEPDTLASLVRQFEHGGVFPAEGDMSKWKWLSWNDSTVQLINRVHQHTQLAIGGTGARRA